MHTQAAISGGGKQYTRWPSRCLEFSMESVAEFGRDFVSETIKNVRGQAGKFRMETFGELAAGLMHDMFAFVRGVEMHLRDVIEQIDRGADKQAIKNSSLTALQLNGNLGSMCRGLHEYGRGDETRKENINLLDVINHTLECFRDAFSKSVEISVVGVGKEQVLAYANQTQVMQILVNLIYNAAQAMGGRPGKITIYVHMLRRQSDEAMVEGAMTQSKFVAFSVKDDGPGMSPEVFSQVSKCFFTTRRERGGTGLGLFMVKRLAHENGGYVIVSTKEEVSDPQDHGTVFTVFLPNAG